MDAPAVTTGEEEVWSDAAGEEEPGPLTEQQKREAIQRLEDAGPSGFDPAPYIERMQTPGLWLYGGADKSRARSTRPHRHGGEKWEQFTCTSS
jgi:hypothetical protein